MKRKFLSAMLAICVVLTLVPITANAMSINVHLNITGEATLTLDVESGDSIDNVKEKIKAQTGYPEEAQTLKYEGEVLENGKTLADYNIQKTSTIELFLADSVHDGLAYTVSDDKVTITVYTGSATDVIITATIADKPVTTIGANAFNNKTNITSVIIPSSVTSIGQYAFDNCTSLESVFLPDSLDVTSANIRGEATKVRYSLDNGKVTITGISLGTYKSSVDIPAAICGYPVVAVATSEQSKVGGHTCAGGQATCQTKAFCVLCGAELPGNHTGGTEIKDATKASCTAAGYTGDTYCKGCGAKLSAGSAIAKLSHTDNDKNHACDLCQTTLSEHTGGTANCVSRAICDYCGGEYGMVDGTKHNLEKVPAKGATVTETGNSEYWHCKYCGSNFSDKDGKNSIVLKNTVTEKLPPDIINGKGQIVTAGEKKDLVFRSNAAFGDFIRVELDGETLDAKNYTAEEGSTIVTLKADYVETISAGEHTVGIVSTSGTAAAEFTVNAKAVADNDTNSDIGATTDPQAEDNSNMPLWIVLILVGGLLIFLAIKVISTKSKKSDE